ncbi:PilN domain-containing protein [Caballeronia sp. DA-9]|uniref:PilN domain-containing protein n=1 Tax=Caballeronia sp. DA-9 TaxID=3436237 RepID=UPI003F67BE2C
MSAVGLHAFNLLPYRPGARRRARNRALALLAGASVAGCAAAGVLAGWDALARVRIDEQRGALDRALAGLNSSVAEHARLVEQQALRRREQSAAAPIAEPGAQFLGLLDALAHGASEGNIGLQRVSQRASEVELAASAPDSHAAATWLKALENVPGVRAVEIVEMHRRVSLLRPTSAKSVRAVSVAAQDKSGGYDFVAVVRWVEGAGNAKSAKQLKVGKPSATPARSATR